MRRAAEIAGEVALGLVLGIAVVLAEAPFPLLVLGLLAWILLSIRP